MASAVRSPARWDPVLVARLRKAGAQITEAQPEAVVGEYAVQMATTQSDRRSCVACGQRLKANERVYEVKTSKHGGWTWLYRALHIEECS